MASIINETIGNQGFEIVRAKIREILHDELQSQITKRSLSYTITVDEERQNAIDTTEDVLVNILFNNADYSQITEIDRQGETEFYIDVYASDMATVSNSASLNSSTKNQQVVGMISYILSHEAYYILGLPYGTIGGTYVTNIRMGEPQNNGDSKISTFCRITFSVRIQERQLLRSGVNLQLSTTRIKHDNTEKGVLIQRQ